MIPAVRRVAASVGLAAARLRRTPRRTLLAIVGVALAVLAVTLLASVGVGVLSTGEQKFDESGRDLWVSGGPLQIRAQPDTPIVNSLVDAHSLANEIEQHPDVALATPMAFQAVYAGRNASDLQLLTGVGLLKAHNRSAISLTEGTGLERDDVHYANGTYDGPMTKAVVIDPQTAAAFNVSVGDQLHLGGSKASARTTYFTVTGISPTFTNFLGTRAAVVHLSELQELVGTTGADRASFITVRLRPDADANAVERELSRTYPELEIQTNREQLQSLVRDKVLVIASAAALVALAVITGLGLTVNLLLLTVSQQREELAALRAIGLQPRLLASMIGTQGFIIGCSGGVIGLALTPVSVVALNDLVAALVGFESLLQTPVAVYIGGALIAVGIGTSSAIAAGWYLGRSVTLADIQG